MLENIKIILGLEKNDYDTLIQLFIDKVTKRVKGYCNIDDLDSINIREREAINEFIEDKVCNIVAYKLSQMGENVDNSTTVTPSNQGAIKSITRGDTSITYNYDSVTADTTTTTKSSPELTEDEKSFLNSFRRCRIL